MDELEKMAREIVSKLPCNGDVCTMLVRSSATIIADALRQVRREALEEAAKVAFNPVFIQARDTEWDEGVNYAKRFISNAIRNLIPAE